MCSICDQRMTTQQLMDWADEAQFERDQEVRDYVYSLEGYPCLDCGGIITTDTTPGYVYKEKEVCDCNAQDGGEAAGGGVGTPADTASTRLLLVPTGGWNWFGKQVMLISHAPWNWNPSYSPYVHTDDSQ